MFRVLQVIGSLNSGGSQSLMMNIYKNIDLDKIQFDFIIDRKDELLYADEIKKLGGRIYVLPQYKGYNILSYKKAWNNFFKQHTEYEIVHGHVRSTASIYLKIAKKHGLYTIAHSHSISSGKGFKAIIKNILQYRIRYIADYFMGCSKEANEWLFGRKIANSNKCIVLKNGIDIEKFKFSEKKRNKIRQELNIDDDTTVIGHVGRFSDVKNHKFLIDIFNEYLKINYNSILLLVGNGDLEQVIKDKVKKLNINNKVYFLGVRKDTDYLYSTFDCFVFPSLYEGLGITLIESQVSGLKTITSKDVIPIETKITDLIEYISLNIKPLEWAKKISVSDKNRGKVNEALLNTDFDIKKVVNKLEKFYEEVQNN